MFDPECDYNAETKIWSGPVLDDETTQVSIGEKIRSSLRNNRNKIGQICGRSGVTLTNEEILLRSLKIAYFLAQELKLTHHDNVASIVVRNTENVAPLIFGLLHCGLSINPLDSSFDKDEFFILFKYIKPKVVFCDADKYEVVSSALKALQNEAVIYIILENTDHIPVTTIKQILDKTSTNDAYGFRPIEPTDLQKHAPFIICSSGTTGTSKGVRIPHSYFLPRDNVSFGGAGAILSFSSLYWVSGWLGLIFGTLEGITRVITDDPFSPELMLRLIEQYQITIVISSPSQMALITKCPDLETRDLSSWRLYICGGSAVSPTMCNELQKKVPHCFIVVYYGCTEVGQITRFIFSTRKAGSVGQIMNNIQLKIVDDCNVALGPNERGEICLKTRNQFLGYYGRPNDTAITLDSDGWVHTGDIGYMDNEGFLYIVDRKKEIMKYKGYHVAPSELEGALGDLSGVNSVCVCAIPHPIDSDHPAALIVRDIAANIREEDIHEFMKATFSDHKQLRGGVFFVDALPDTPSGKICRPKAKQLALKLYVERQMPRDDEDFVAVVKRQKEIIKYKNYHVTPSELESALCNLPGVNRAYVCGIPHPIDGEHPATLIVPDKGANIREESVQEFMKARFPEHKQLRGGVFFVETLLETLSGKIIRPKAKELALKLYVERTIQSKI